MFRSCVSESRGGWAVRPNEPYGFRGRKAILNHALNLSLIIMSTDIRKKKKTVSGACGWSTRGSSIILARAVRAAFTEHVMPFSSLVSHHMEWG